MLFPGRAARRSRAPAFLGYEDEDDGPEDGGLLDGVDSRRRRRHYDERPPEDDMEGEEDVSTACRFDLAQRTS